MKRKWMIQLKDSVFHHCPIILNKSSYKWPTSFRKSWGFSGFLFLLFPHVKVLLTSINRKRSQNRVVQRNEQNLGRWS